jgi:hypothetical protein
LVSVGSSVRAWRHAWFLSARTTLEIGIDEILAHGLACDWHMTARKLAHSLRISP